MPAVGYARVSTNAQELTLQLDALGKAGCERIFEDKGVSGTKTIRPGLNALMAYVREGDVVTVYRLDRLGRSLPHLLDLVAELDRRQVGFRSISEALDTTTPGGRLVFHVFGALGQFERDLIRERTRAGLDAAAARGRKGGRPRSLSADKLARARDLLGANHHNVAEVARRLKVSRTTLYAALADSREAAIVDLP